MQVANIAILVILSTALVSTGGYITVLQRQVQEVGVAIPSQWGGDRMFIQSTPEQWVETFGDSQLRALVDTALTNNYELKAAARVDATIAQARIDGSGRWPQFFFTADHQQVQIRDAGFGSSRFGVFEGCLV